MQFYENLIEKTFGAGIHKDIKNYRSTVMYSIAYCSLSPDVLMIGGAPAEKEGDSKESSEVEGESDLLPDITVPPGVIRAHRLGRAVQTPTFRHLEIDLIIMEGSYRGGLFLGMIS